MSITALRALAVGLALAAAACSSDDSSDATASDESTTFTEAPDMPDASTSTTKAPATTAAAAEVTGPITAGNGPAVPQPALPVPDGYVEEEFFVDGEAASFRIVGDAGAEGFWNAEPADTAEYRTRMIVRRPPADEFSGVVVVEWLNVSAVESSPDWAYLSEEIARAGHAYVALSTQALGVVGGESLLAVEIDQDAAADAGAEADPVDTGGLVNTDPERYGTLAHPGDAYAFDIFSQVGAALADSPDVALGGLKPTSVIALGESQSAGFLTTYLNAIHPLVDVYDGFLVHSRGAGAAPIDGSFGVAAEGEEAGSSFTEDGVLIRTDLDAPVFIFEAETDLTLLGYSAARQPDTDTVRTWEVAGTAHADAHVFRAVVGGPRDPAVGSLIGCGGLINSGPHHEAVQAALNHLVTWVAGGSPPPPGERLELLEGESVAIARDELGMAIGGVRNPLVDVPVAIVTGDPLGDPVETIEDFDVCDLFGQTVPLDSATLVELHGSADDYVAAFGAAADDAVSAGFLLPGDADQLRAEAETNRALFG